MNFLRFKQYIVVFLILMVFVGVFLSYTLFDTLESTKQCQIESEQKCVLSTNQQHVSVQFLQVIEVEEELKLQIKVPEDTKIAQMWVQGINMFMGKHLVLTDSVFVQNDLRVYEASLFLGSCSEPKMKWQLIIQTENNQGLKESWFFNFDTDNNKLS